MSISITHNLTEFITAIERWKNTPGRITAAGELQVMVKGKWISKEDFDRHNPKPTYEPAGGNNLQCEKDGLLYGVIAKK